MNFVYPLGLLGLLGIPVIVLIYILKNRYTEKVIPSTYIWNMSEKFLKRRVPISKIAGIISLVLQLLTVVFISLAIAQPHIVLKNQAYSYCFVLDASGSMNFEQEGKTRFEIAQKRITDMIDDAKNGSDFTVIYAGSSTEFVFEGLTDKKMAKQLVKELEVSYVTMEPTEALAAAQEYFEYNPSVHTYLLTDQEYLVTENIKIIDVSEGVDNCAVTNVAYELVDNRMQITGTAVSYSGEKELTVQLSFDDSDEIASQKVLAGKSGTDFQFTCDKTGFGYFKVSLAEEDALMLDNEVVVYDVAYQNVSDVLLVSDSPFFLRAALVSAGITNLKYIQTKEYANDTGYGLYIFDSFMPATLPDDGAVWFINPKNTLAGTNFSYQGEVSPRSAASYSLSSERAVRTLLTGIVDPTDKVGGGKPFVLKSYDKCRLNGKFYELAHCDNNPILFVGSNAYGNREAVFAFDIHDSAQFALSGYLPVLVKNLIDFSFPSIVTETIYSCGDVMEINMIASCRNIRIETPAGHTAYPDASTTITEYRLTEVGVYNIVLVMKDKTERVVNVFSQLPEEERSPRKISESFTITGTAEDSRTDGYFDTLLYLCIILAVLAVADFGMYCYEQYQLR